MLAVVLFLIFPESIELIQHSLNRSDQSGEIEIISGTISRFGTCVMIGFLLPLLLGALCPRSTERAHTDVSVNSGGKIKDKEMQIQKSTTIEEGDENESNDEDDEETKSDKFELNGPEVVSNMDTDMDMDID